MLDKIKKRIKRLFHNFKAVKWAKPKETLQGIGSVIIFTGFFILVFALIDFLGGILMKLF